MDRPPHATLRVLIVDSDADRARSTSALIAAVPGLSAHVIRSSSPAHTLERLGTDVPDLLIVDGWLETDDGLSRIRAIREQGFTLPILLLTSVGDEERAVAALQAGATDYLARTRLSPDLFEAKMRHALALAEQQRQRAEAERALRESERRYRELFDDDLTGDFIASAGGRLVACNNAFVHIFGLGSRAAALSTNLRRLFPGPADFDATLNLLRRERTLSYYELTLKRLDGQRVNAVANLVGSFDEGGALEELKGYLFDNTERKRLEETLRQAQKMEAIGQLAGGVAHDFNNLLTAILGYCTLLLEELPPGDRVRRDIEEIRAAGERAASLTRQLLAFSRKQVLQPAVLDLNDVVANMEPMLRRLIGEDIELQMALAPRRMRVRADPASIEQVLLNLALNARDAMPGGGRLTIETSATTFDAAYGATHVSVVPGEYAMLAVTDTGLGMDARTRARLFEPFFTTKPQGKGTGLGLATVYGIVKQSTGYVWAYSEPGLGATFKVYLPRVDAETLERGAAAQPAADVERGSETVLLVEDEASLRKLAGDVLTRLGYTVLVAEHGREALTLLERHGGDVHLLVTDVVLPQMSGRQLAERVLFLHPGSRVLYMSGYADHAIVHHGVLQAGTAFLQKPFTPGAFARMVRMVLDDRVD